MVPYIWIKLIPKTFKIQVKVRVLLSLSFCDENVILNILEYKVKLYCLCKANFIASILCILNTDN